MYLTETLIHFLQGFAINILAILVLVRLIYYRKYHKTDHFLTFIGFNIIIFFLTFLLHQVEIGIGEGFGLFAIFSMLRYRTEDISAKDMTYLFFSIALGMVASVSHSNLLEQCVYCFLLLASIALLETNIVVKKEHSKNVQYDRADILAQNNETLLIEDINNRTGLNIHRVEIQHFDFLKDSAQIKIYYY